MQARSPGRHLVDALVEPVRQPVAVRVVVEGVSVGLGGGGGSLRPLHGLPQAGLRLRPHRHAPASHQAHPP